MTKNKRYTYLNYSKDGYIGSFYENDKPLTTKEVWDILNEQEKEIKFMSDINEIHRSALLDLEYDIKKLKEENKQLKIKRFNELGDRMTKNRFKIIDEEFISYYGGNGCLISNGNCEFWLWHDKSGSQKVCDKLNIIMEENEQLKKENKHLRCTIESNSQDDYIDFLEKHGYTTKNDLDIRFGDVE